MVSIFVGLWANLGIFSVNSPPPPHTHTHTMMEMRTKKRHNVLNNARVFAANQTSLLPRGGGK